ncbi:MAG TPA: TraB/GumN family protein [Devosia sp.]|nr:TraB/GumN family protein [Devosia sp.]
MSTRRRAAIATALPRGIGAIATALLGLVVLAAFASPAQAAPAMWEVSDGTHKVVLFGSVHVLPVGTQWRTPAFDAALAAAPEVYFETDIGPLGVLALTAKMVVLGFQSAGTSWVGQLTPAQLAELKPALAAIGMTPGQADRFPPWVAELQIAQGTITGGKTGAAAPGPGVDAQLQTELPKQRKAFFETPGQDFDLLAGDPLSVQIAQLFQTIESGQPTAATGLDAVVSAWAAGDVADIATTLKSTDPQDIAREQRLLFDRNRNWVPIIEGMLKAGDQDLIVVGAAHLAGDGSVLDLLGQAGYTVTRVQ